jgi:hypothetical protein
VVMVTLMTGMFLLLGAGNFTEVVSVCADRL